MCVVFDELYSLSQINVLFRSFFPCLFIFYTYTLRNKILLTEATVNIDTQP